MIQQSLRNLGFGCSAVSEPVVEGRHGSTGLIVSADCHVQRVIGDGGRCGGWRLSGGGRRRRRRGGGRSGGNGRGRSCFAAARRCDQGEGEDDDGKRARRWAPTRWPGVGSPGPTAMSRVAKSHGIAPVHSPIDGRSKSSSHGWVFHDVLVGCGCSVQPDRPEDQGPDHAGGE